ncbi:MAG TPA: SDR family oxidoreductase [Acidobacteriota bacterium]|nr:SDR family oxidoreductase [Acidobacteriota bacterium]HNT16322.1 SDR family oxidoreductase [Acidobacteriota bacterium]
MGFKEKYGRYALVTGASAGIGEAFARLLAKRGFDLILVARREEKLDLIAEELRRKHGIEIMVIPMDLTLEDSADELFRKVGEFDVGLLVNNAGFGYYGKFVKQAPERFSDMIKLNILTFTLLTRKFADRFIKKGRGGIILVSSLAAFQPTPGMALYGATKGFELLLGEALAEEIKGKNVDITVLCPSATLTEFQRVAGGVPHDGMTAEFVADNALNCLGRKRIAIPGLWNKILGKANRFLPRNVVTWITARALGHYLPDE